MDQRIENEYIAILGEELIRAMGCTEPIAIAYGAALCRETLGEMPTEVAIVASSNIIKNVKSVVVPNTGGQRGIAVAAAAGIVAGNAEKELGVLEDVTKEDIENMHAFLQEVPVKLSPSRRPYIFDIQVLLTGERHTAKVEIAGYHTNVIRIERDEKVLKEVHYEEDQNNYKTDRSLLNVEDIVTFANTVDLLKVEDLIQGQINCNKAIAEEALAGNYGANIGKTILEKHGDDVQQKAKAYAAAGSDGRMSGSEMPVVINSGSGNQGLTTSLPVIVYAEEMGVSEEKKIRALVLSNLITIHLKTGVGRLSAYCGATSAGCGAAAGVTYLHGGGAKEIATTISNALAINSGMVCDGAKASCAAKIASAVEAGLLGHHMQMQGHRFEDGEGIIVDDVEHTIENVGILAREGMKETDHVIIDLMTKHGE